MSHAVVGPALVSGSISLCSGRFRRCLGLGSALLIALASLLPPATAEAGFIEVPQFGTGATLCVAWADADLDGDLDVTVGNYFNQANELYVNNGNGTFTRQTPFGNDNTFAVVFGDYDNDGDPDLAVGNGASQQNRLYVNQGNGTYTPQNQFGLLSTVALAWADYDLDGDLDLAVGNGILGANQQNYLYINNGDGTFTGVAQFGGLQTDSVAWGDYDADGDPDLAVGNGGFGSIQQNYLYINNGDGTFTGVPEFGTGDTACLAWGDADLDGDLDVAVGNGDFTTADQNYLYLNDGAGNFIETPEFGLGSTDGVAWGDYDADGDLDLAAGNEHTPTQNYLYVNDAPAGSWLALRLVGHHHDLGNGYSNRDGVGARVFVYEAGFSGQADHLLGCREIAAHGGFASQNDIAPTFGFPGQAAVDVHIVWPGSNGAHIVQDLLATATGQRLTVHEQGTPAAMAETPGAPALQYASLRIAPNPMRGFTRLEMTTASAASSVLAPPTLRIVDVGGRVVRTLQLELQDTTTGVVAWDRRDTAGARVPNGVYFIHFEALDAPRGRIVVVP